MPVLIPARLALFVSSRRSLAFSVTMFCTTACFALAVMMLRRSPKIGGELGGPKVSKVLTSMLFVSLWLFYVLMSSLEAYGYIEGTRPECFTRVCYEHSPFASCRLLRARSCPVVAPRMETRRRRRLLRTRPGSASHKTPDVSGERRETPNEREGEGERESRRLELKKKKRRHNLCP